MKSDYVQASDNAFAAQLITFKQEIPGYVSVLKLAADVVSGQAAHADYFDYCLKCQGIVQNSAVQSTQ